MDGEKRCWETPFLLTPCTRWWPSGEAAATEGGIVVTAKRDNCPAERERS